MRLHKQRRGGAVLELLLALPVLIIGVLAIVEFGLLRANQQQLEYASRVGANIAVDDPNPTVTDIDSAVRAHLQEAGIDTADANIRITLQENTTGATIETTAGTLNCTVAGSVPAAPAGQEFVRVTVCLDIVESQMTPNLLQTLGFDIAGWQMQQTTTLRYER